MLPDFEQDGWWLPGLVEGIGALWLLWRPAAPAFAICLIGTLWPLLFLRDVLTQSALLSLWALVGLVGAVRPRLRSAALDAVLWVTAGTYLLAALHKLNSAFFTPELGCAEHAWAQVAARYGLPDALPGAPFVAVGMEVALGVLLLRRSLWAWPLGLAFHLPLTVTLAPAFGAVMLSGYVAGLDARTLVRWRRLLRRWPLWVVVGLGVAGVEYAWAGRGELAPALKTGVAAVLLFVSVIAGLRWRPASAAEKVSESDGLPRLSAAPASLLPLLCSRLRRGPHTPGFARVRTCGHTTFGRGHACFARLRQPQRVPVARHPPHWLPVAALTLWVANGLTPYFGVQYQHAAAMLSGLRIDAGCHNSLVMPAWLVVEDPYVRIDTASLPGRPERERILLESLWNLPALHTMHRNWCIPENRPITLTGTWRGEAFHIEDLCAEDWRSALPGDDWFPGFQRYQKNLGRECRQACIH